MRLEEISRRDLLAGAGALAAALAAPARAQEQAQPLPALGPVNAPWHVLDPEGAALIAGTTEVQRVGRGYTFVEGPVWFGAFGVVIFSDVGASRQHMWNARSGEISVFRAQSNYTNGAAKDREGRLVCCESGARRITRFEPDGSLTVLADKYNGKKLNWTNDVVVNSDGSIWFTDPTHGFTSMVDGKPVPPEQPSSYVYRLDPKTGRLAVVIEDSINPNGLCFSPDEKRLYFLDNKSKGVGGLYVYDVVANGTRLANPRLLVGNANGGSDGFRCDEHGNVWASWNGATAQEKGVRVFSPAGKPLLQLELPDAAANLCFVGEADQNRIFVCARGSVYTARVNVRAATKFI